MKGWRGNVKARHFVLALRDYYLDKLTSEAKGVLGMGTSALVFSNSADPDAWAIKYIDLMWVQPILEAFDDDASGFITVTEVNRFTSSRPVDWRCASHYSCQTPSDESKPAPLVGFLGSW